MTACDYLDNTTTLTLYLGRDNPVALIPYSDTSGNTVFDMTAVTRVTMSADLVASTATGDATIGDSDIDATLVSWLEVEEGEWRIYGKVGMFVGIGAGEYNIRTTLYSPSSPNGLVLPDTITNLVVTLVASP